MENTKQKRKKLPIIIFGVIALFAIIFFVWFNFFMKPYQRVLLAAKKTFGSKNYGGYILKTDDGFQLSGRIKTMGQSLGFKTELNKDNVLISLPGLSDKLFVYDYRGENDGYFPKKLGVTNVALFGRILESVYDTEKATSAKDAVKSATSLLKNIPQGKTDKKAFSVGNHTEDCDGYYFDTEYGRINCYIFRGKLAAIENEDESFFIENEIIHIGDDFTAKINKTEEPFTLTGEEFNIGKAQRADIEALVLERMIREFTN